MYPFEPNYSVYSRLFHCPLQGSWMHSWLQEMDRTSFSDVKMLGAGLSLRVFGTAEYRYGNRL